MNFDKRYETIINELQIDEGLKQKALNVATSAALLVAPAAGYKVGKMVQKKLKQKFTQAQADADATELKVLNKDRKLAGKEPLTELPKNYKKGKK